VLTTLDASEVRALAGVTRLAIAANNRVEALDSLRHYTAAIGTANAPLLAAAADLHLQLDRHDDALDLATRSQKLSASAAASRVLGLVCLHRGDHAEAAKHLKAALDLAADKSKPDRQVQEALLRAHLGRGDPSAAEAAVKELGDTGELPPSLVQLRTLVSTLTARRAALLKDARVPGEKAAAWCQALDRLVCAEQVHADGRPAKQVEALLAEALAGGVECGPAHGLRGLLALERGRLSQALADAEKAVALSPAEPRGHYVRGRVRLERGDARALADLEKAAELSRRQDGGVLHWLAAALFQAGRGKDAVVTQREALQRRPGDGELAEQLRRFEEAQRAGGGQQ
jgi:tetratricopeptide (TPR) repeat protein